MVRRVLLAARRAGLAFLAVGLAIGGPACGKTEPPPASSAPAGGVVVTSSPGGGTTAPPADGDPGNVGTLPDQGGGGPGASGAPGTSPGGGGTPVGGGGGCADLMTGPDAGVELTFATGSHAVCALATSDPAGQTALGIQGGAFSTEVRFELYSGDGTVAQGELSLLSPTTSLDIDPWFHWTATGYVGIVHDPLPPQRLRTWDAAGNVLASGGEYTIWSAPDGQGGSVVLARSFDTDASPPLGPTQLQWVSAAGVVSRAVTLDDDPDVMQVAWDTGHVLTVVSGPAASRARWFDGTGVALTPWFDAGAAFSPSESSIHLLVDGRVVLGDGQTWRAAFRDGVASVEPVPGWLAGRPGTRLATVRQGRGYALWPLASTGGADDTSQTTFEILTASGESCGTVSIPAAPTTPGVERRPTRLDVGQDGTLFQTEILVGQDLGFGIHCGFRWWPALLR